MSGTLPLDQLDSPAQFAARPKENPNYRFGTGPNDQYMQQNDIFAMREQVLRAVEEDHGNEPRMDLDGLTPKEYCTKNIQLYRKEHIRINRPNFYNRPPELLIGHQLTYTDGVVFGRFALPTKEELYKAFGRISEVMSKWLEPDSHLIRQTEAKGAPGGLQSTRLIRDEPEPSDIVDNTGQIMRRDQIGIQVYQRVVFIQRTEEANRNEWFCVIV